MMRRGEVSQPHADSLIFRARARTRARARKSVGHVLLMKDLNKFTL